ncbi:MAG: archaellin/type IV pilin N-terminal domain-containing protein [Archaeoglobaceae archaeon]
MGCGWRKNDKGFTGLEAAIVLIAFVVVAAVFSYVMLGAGFYTTQKSKQVVDTGVKQASSSLTLDGQYIYLDASENAGGKTGSNGKVGAIFFYVTQTAGGSPVDLEKTSIAITTASGYKQVFFKPLIAKDDNVYYKRNEAPPSSGELLERKSGEDSTYPIQHLLGNPSLGGQVNVSINNLWCNGTVEKITSIYLKYNDAANETDYYMPAVSVYINSTDDNDDFDNCTFITSKGWWYEPVVGDRDNVVEANEKYKIIIAASVTNSTISNIVWKDTSPWEEIGDIKPNDVITIEVRPPIGAPLSITKQLPPSFTDLTYV